MNVDTDAWFASAPIPQSTIEANRCAYDRLVEHRAKSLDALFRYTDRYVGACDYERAHRRKTARPQPIAPPPPPPPTAREIFESFCRKAWAYTRKAAVCVFNAVKYVLKEAGEMAVAAGAVYGLYRLLK